MSENSAIDLQNQIKNIENNIKLMETKYNEYVNAKNLEKKQKKLEETEKIINNYRIAIQNSKYNNLNELIAEYELLHDKEDLIVYEVKFNANLTTFKHLLELLNISNEEDIDLLKDEINIRKDLLSILKGNENFFKDIKDNDLCYIINYGKIKYKYKLEKIKFRNINIKKFIKYLLFDKKNAYKYTYGVRFINVNTDELKELDKSCIYGKIQIKDNKLLLMNDIRTSYGY